MKDLDLAAIKDAIADIGAHRHPSGYDLYCHNLQSWMGERAHLLVAEIERLRSQRDKVAALCDEADSDACPNVANHDPAIVEGSFYCWRCNGTGRVEASESVHIGVLRAIYAEDGAS